MHGNIEADIAINPRLVSFFYPHNSNPRPASAAVHPEKSPRLRLQLEDLSEAVSFCEEEVEVFVLRT